MKIEFDKALLWLIPYLYLISASYYWGYWGSFGIDAFNYYPVSDLVKGVTAPLSRSLFAILTAGILTIIVRHYLTKSGIIYNTYFLIAAIALVLITISAMVITKHYRHGNSLSIIMAQDKAIMLMFASLVLAVITNNYLPQISELAQSIRFFSIFSLLLIPCQSYAEGLLKSSRIKANEKFDYVITDSLVQSQKIYKYLGKAGEYQFFLTVDNKKYIITSTNKFNPLVVENYSKEDSASIIRFKDYQKIHTK